MSVVEQLQRAASWPTNFPGTLEEWMLSCCALHRRLDLDQLLDSGCGRMGIGTHRSIVVLYERGIHFCHASEGQRVLDYRVMEMGFLQKRSRFRDIESRGARFKSKYCSGYEADVGLYGAGYCYLACFSGVAMSRAARILGPLPLIADLVRVVAVIGVDMTNPLVISQVKNGFWHVELDERVGVVRDRRGLLVFLNDVCAETPLARVGGGETFEIHDFCGFDYAVNSGTQRHSDAEGAHVDGVVERIIVRESKREGCSPYNELEYVSCDCFGLFADERVERVSRLLGSQHVVMSHAEYKLCLVALTAPAYLLAMPEAKRLQSVLANIGDNAMKLAQAMQVYAVGETSRNYSAETLRGTNVEMARVFDETGIRDCALVGDLSVTSKANATMLQALVGVLAITQSKGVLKDVLKWLKLVRDCEITEQEIRTVYQSVPTVASLQLSSRQQEKVFEMLLSGDL